MGFRGSSVKRNRHGWPRLRKTLKANKASPVTTITDASVILTVTPRAREDRAAAGKPLTVLREVVRVRGRGGLARGSHALCGTDYLC